MARPDPQWRSGLGFAGPLGYRREARPPTSVQNPSLEVQNLPDPASTRSGVRRRYLLLFAQEGNPVLQCPQADPQHLGGTLAVSAHVIESEPDIGPFKLGEPLARLKHHRTLVAGHWGRAPARSRTEGRRRKVILVF